MSNIDKLKLFEELTSCILYSELSEIVVLKLLIELKLSHDKGSSLFFMNFLNFTVPFLKVWDYGCDDQNYQPLKVIFCEIVPIEER